MKRILRILNKIFVLREESKYYPDLRKVSLHKSGLVLLGIGIVIFVFGLSIHDKQLTVENGNAIVGALLGIVGIIVVYLGFYSRFSTMNVQKITTERDIRGPPVRMSSIVYFRAPLKLPVMSRTKLNEVTVLQANIMLYRCSHSL